MIDKIQDAARANRFEELRKSEDGLAAFGEDALPEIRRALIERVSGERSAVSGEEMHPRAKLHLLGAAARVESERAELLLDEFARTPGPAQEAWLRMTARDLPDERHPDHDQRVGPHASGAETRADSPQRPPEPALSAGAGPAASARLASGPAAREAAAQELATALREEPDRKRRLDTIDALIAIPGEEGSKTLERYILENKGDADREWEANRALRLLIERHGASQELGPFRWVLAAGSFGTLRPSAEDVPPTSWTLALRAIEAAAQTPSAQGLAFLLGVRESFPQGHPLRMRADAAIARRQAAEKK